MLSSRRLRIAGIQYCICRCTYCKHHSNLHQLILTNSKIMMLVFSISPAKCLATSIGSRGEHVGGCHHCSTIPRRVRALQMLFILLSSIRKYTRGSELSIILLLYATFLPNRKSNKYKVHGGFAYWLMIFAL